MKTIPDYNNYISPQFRLVDFEQEGVLCLSSVSSNHGGYGYGGDIDIDLNINEQ